MLGTSLGPGYAVGWKSKEELNKKKIGERSEPRATSSPGRFSLALGAGREKALASAGRSVIVIGWLI